MGNYNLGQLSRWLFLKWSNFSTSIGLQGKKKNKVKERTGCELSQLFLTSEVKLPKAQGHSVGHRKIQSDKFNSAFDITF